MPPGARADWLVRCREPGTYEFRSHALPAPPAPPPVRVPSERLIDGTYGYDDLE